MKDIPFWQGPDHASGMALLSVKKEEPYWFLGDRREGGLEVFGDCAGMYGTEGKVNAE